MKTPIKKIVAIILLFVVVSFLIPRPAQAQGIWGESIFGAMTYKEMLEEMYKKIQDTLVASLRNAAIRLIQSKLLSLLNAGGSGSPGIISDWRAFIYSSAATYSTKVVDSFFSNMKSGLSSTVTKKIITPAQNALASSATSKAPNIENYVKEGRTDKIFASGYADDPWTALLRSTDPQNSVGYLFAQGAAVKQESFRQKEEEKKVEGAAGQGYEGKKDTSSSTKNGVSSSTWNGMAGKTDKITVPGSTVKDTVSKGMGMPFDMIAMARTIPDIVTSMVTTTLTQVLNQGLAKVSSKISDQIGGEVGSIVGSTVGSVGSTVGNTTLRVGTSGVQQMIQKGLK